MEVAEVQSERSLLNEISHDAMNATLESVPVLNVDAPASTEEPVPVAVTLSVQAEDNLAKLIVSAHFSHNMLIVERGQQSGSQCRYRYRLRY